MVGAGRFLSVRMAERCLTPYLLLLSSFSAGAQEAKPPDLASRMLRQDQMLAAGETEKALAEARDRVERDRKDPEAQYLLGRVLGNAGKVEEARSCFEGALELDIGYAPAWRGMALVHLKGRDVETAAREARKAFDLDGTPESRILLVQCLYEKGERPAAYRLLQEALAAAPGDNDLRSFYATLLFEERLYQQAEKELRQVLASDPGHLPARQTLVVLLVNTGRPDEASAECREAVKRSPGDLRFRLLLRDILVGKHDFPGASAVMEEVLRLDLSPEDRVKAEGDLKKLREAAERAGGPRPLDEKDVLAALDSPDALRRREAMRTLWERDISFLPDAAVRRLTDPDEVVRTYAVRLLGRHGDARAAGLLEVLLFHPRDRDASAAVRSQAALAVAAIGGAAALPVLVRALEDPEPEVLGAAIRGIASVTGKCLVDDPFAPIPEADRPAVRERYRKWWMESPTGRQWRAKAARAAGEAGMRSLVQYAVPWLDEDDPAIRAAVLEAMALLTKDESWRAVPTESPEERAGARSRAEAAVAEKR